MQDEKNKAQPETDYELALRLAGLRKDGEKLVAKKISPVQKLAPTSQKADVRVNTLNKPSSILKKWHDASAANKKAKAKKNASSNVPKKGVNKVVSQNSIRAASTTENDHFFDLQPGHKNFKKVFEDLDSEPLLASKQKVDLHSLNDDLLEDEPSKSR